MRKISDRHIIETSTRKYAQENEIRKVILGLSGGADSVATALALLKSGVEVIALHANFHLRGEESNRDMEFVKEFCLDHNIPFEIKEFNIQEYQQKNRGCSVEMACRNLRHEWFRDKKEQTGADRIVTGHNADDNIETLFINLMRGAGTRGLKGMDYDNGVIWRPLLSFHRKEILIFLEKEGARFVTDSTNLESDYRRNFLRNKVLPLLRKEWEGADKALDRAIKNLNAENRIVESEIKKSLPDNNKPLKVETILKFPSPLLLIRRFLDKAEPFTTTPDEILAAIKAAKPHIRTWNLKKGKAWLRNGRLFVEMIHGEGRS